MALAIADRRIVDHGVEAAQRIDLGRDVLRAGDGLEIADDDGLRLGQGAPGFLGTVGVAGMKDDLVAFACEQIRLPSVRGRWMSRK